jgi:hypothetical protein
MQQTNISRVNKNTDKLIKILYSTNKENMKLYYIVHCINILNTCIFMLDLVKSRMNNEN